MEFINEGTDDFNCEKMVAIAMDKYQRTTERDRSIDFQHVFLQKWVDLRKMFLIIRTYLKPSEVPTMDLGWVLQIMNTVIIMGEYVLLLMIWGLYYIDEG